MRPNLSGVDTKALDELLTEALAYLQSTANVHETYGRVGEAETCRWHAQVIEERVRRLENTVKALMPKECV